MNKIKLISFVAAIVLLSLGSVQPASAYIFGSTSGSDPSYNPLPFNSSDVFLTLNGDILNPLKATDGGWYNGLGFHDPNNTSYMVDNDPYGPHNWFLFNIAGLNLTVTSATLTLYSYDVSPGGDYKLFDVTTPLDHLQAGTGGVAAFDDLGSGDVYGQRWYSTDDSDEYRTITLTSAFLFDFNTAIANHLRNPNNELLSKFAIGGRIPEPATIGLFGIGLLGFAAGRRRKAA